METGCPTDFATRYLSDNFDVHLMMISPKTITADRRFCPPPDLEFYYRCIAKGSQLDNTSTWIG